MFKPNLKRIFSMFVFYIYIYIVNCLSNFFFLLSSNENVSEKRAAVVAQNCSFKRKLDIEDHCFMIHTVYQRPDPTWRHGDYGPNCQIIIAYIT